MAEGNRGFQVPPEVPRYFAEKQLAPRFSWLDIWAEEHANAFTVAKAVEIELLEAFQKTIQKAIENGQSFETWRGQLKPELERLGWWKPRLVSDPEKSLPDTLVDFSAPRRLQTIFWSNMRSARAAGQWERIQKTKKALPYLLYVETTAREPRYEHLAWVGIILPVDDPFWETHFPPNGWGCKCAVRQISAREAERLIASGRYLTVAPVIETRPFINKRTGEITHIPVGIDPGWHRNPGIAASRFKSLSGNLSSRVEAIQSLNEGGTLLRSSVVSSIRDIVIGPSFILLYDRAVMAWKTRRSAQKAAKALGLDKAAQDRAAAAAAPWTHSPLPIAVMPIRLDEWRGNLPLTVTITDAAIAHSWGAHPVPVEDWSKVQETLSHGDIVTNEKKDRIWAFLKQPNGKYLMTVLVPRDGAWRVLTHYPISKPYRDRQLQVEGRYLVISGGE